MSFARYFLFAALLAANSYFAAKLPVSSAEAVVYSRYIARPIQETWSGPFHQHIGIPYALLARLAKNLIGVSELALRMPALLAALLYGLVLVRMPLDWRAGALLMLFFLFDPPYVFVTAGGAALALALCAVALRILPRNPWLSGVFLGLALACYPSWIFCCLALLMAADYAKREASWRVIDHFLLPVALTAAPMLAPMLLIQTKPKPAASDDKATRALMRQIPVDRTVTLSVSESIEPGVTFYRRRYHLGSIKPIKPDGPDAESDFYLLLPKDRNLIHKLALQVVADMGGAVLARKM